MRIEMVAAGGLALILAGCATLSRGTTDQVRVQSTPDGATAVSSVGGRCTTPCDLTVARDDIFSVTVSKPGFASQTIAVATRIAGDGAAHATENVATAGLGLAVDAATGALLEHVPNPVVVTLVPLGPAAPAPVRRRKAA